MKDKVLKKIGTCMYCGRLKNIYGIRRYTNPVKFISVLIKADWPNLNNDFRQYDWEFKGISQVQELKEQK